MELFAVENWEKEIQLAFSGDKYLHLINHEIPELKKYMETGIGDIFLKFANAIELLTSITGINSIPVHTFTISFGVLSNIFKRIGTQLKSTVPQIDEDKTYLALLRYQDSELRAEAAGLEDLFFHTHAYLNEIDDQAHEIVVIRLEDRFPTNDSVRFLGKLKAKTYELLTTSDLQSAHRASVYINLYFRLAILRTLVLWQVYCIKERSGFDRPSTQGVLALITESNKSDLEVLTYVTETNIQKSVFLTIFSPTKNENYLHFLRIHRIKIPTLSESFCGSTRNICLSKSPHIKFKMSSLYWGRICGSDKENSDSCKFKLEPVENQNQDNIFYIRSTKYSDYYVYMHEGGNCFSLKGQPGPEGQWKVLQIENRNQPQYIMSPIEWPCRFLYLKSFLGNTYIGGTYDLKVTRDQGLWEIRNAYRKIWRLGSTRLLRKFLLGFDERERSAYDRSEL